MPKLTIPTARDLVVNLFDSAGTTGIIEYLARQGGRPIVFAGAVRDALISVEWGTPARLPRDMDIGVYGLKQEDFHRLARNLGATQNRYGG